MKNSLKISCKRICCIMLVLLAGVLFSGCGSTPGKEENPSSGDHTDQASLPVKTYDMAAIAYDFPTLVEKAQTIVYGEISEVLPAQQRDINEYSKQVYTPMKITPITLLKGGNGTEPILYNRIGGEFQGIFYQIDGDELRLKQGQKIFILMGKYDSDLGPTSVYVENEGNLKVWDDDTQAYQEVSTQEFIQKVKRQLGE